MPTPLLAVHLRTALTRAGLCIAVLGAVACEKPTPPTSGRAKDQPAAQRPPRSRAEEKPGLVAPPPAEPPALRAAGLEYVEVILGEASPEEPLPMVVAIHGLGDRPDNFAHLFEGWTGTARLILPRGVDPTEEDGYSWFPTRARSPDVDALAAGISSSADKIAAAVEELARTRPTVGKPTITGFSQGGMLTFALAIEHPEVFGYAVAVGGWLPPPLWPKAKDDRTYPKMVALHGTADNAVPYEPTAEAIAHLEQLGYDVKLTSYEGVRHAIPPEVRRDLFDRLSDATAAAARATR